MSTAVRPRPRAVGANTGATDQLVVFGISGDLAKQMTFRSLYRLELRGLLQCPILGVAVDDWSDDELRAHARAAIEACGETIDEATFERFAARLSYLRGDFADPATFERVARALDGARSPVFYLEIPPALFGMVDRRPGRRGPDRARAGRRREAVRPRPRVGAGAAGRAGGPPARGAALPDRPLPREDGAGRDPLPAVRERDLRADLEPQLRVLRADHDGRGLRRRRPRPLLRPGRRAARRRGQPPACRSSPPWPWSRRRAPTRGRSRTRSPASCAPRAPPIPPTTCAASTTATARSTASRRTRTTETYAALRLDIENWRWSGVPFFIRTGKCLPTTQTEARLVFRRPPRLGFLPERMRRPEPDQIVVKLDPSTGIRIVVDAKRGDVPRARDDHDGHGVRRGGRRGRDALRGPARRRDARRREPLHAPGRRRGAVADHAAAARRAAARAPVREGHLGPGGRRPSCHTDTAAGTARGWRHDHRGRRPWPSPRAPRRRRRFRRSRPTASSRTATPRRSSRRTARSAGCACRRSTPRACSGRCSIARPASSASGRSASTSRRRARTSPAPTRSSRPGTRTAAGSSSATR